jgi:excisionase family DNA binding protein
VTEWPDTARLVPLLEEILARLDGIAEPDRLLTAQEVAKRLGVTARWVYESAKDGGIPHYKFGKQVRFDWLKVRAWMDECQSGGRVVKFREGRRAA